MLLALLVLAGCARSGSDSGGTSAGGDIAWQDSSAPAPDMAVEEHRGEDAEMADMAEAGVDDGREIVSTGSLTLVAADTGEAVEGIVQIVADAGGRVDERTEHAPSGSEDSSAWLTVRVPAAELEGVIADIEELGEAREVSISTDDVTRMGRDLDARIGALEASTERLLDLMSEADSSEALIAAEEALSQRQAELESLRSQRAYLSEQVALSTLHISVHAERTAEFESGGFLGGLKSGWYALVDFASALLVGIGAAIPWLVIIGVPVVLLVLLARRRRRRRRAQADAGAPQEDVTAA